MGKERTTRSRALRRLEPYNQSPSGSASSRHSKDHGDERTSRRSSSGRREARGSRSRSRSPSRSQQPPEWAKRLLEQQQSNADELKRLQNELANAKGPKAANKQRASEPEFRFAGNKKQYELNRDVAEKIDEALEATEADERAEKLKEGKNLTLEQLWKKVRSLIKESHLPHCNGKFQKTQGEVWVYCDFKHSLKVRSTLEKALGNVGPFLFCVHPVGSVMEL